MQKKLDKEIAKAKREYKEKVEAQFHQGSLSDAWKGLKTISGMEKSKSTSEWPIEEQNDFSEQLNDFYCRFERSDLISDLERTICDLSENKVNVESVEVEPKTVETVFSKLKIRKSTGPDNISAKLLKSCSAQLSHIFSILF